LRFEVTVAPTLLAEPADGRMLVALSRDKKAQPRRSIGETGMNVPPVLGADATAFRSGVTAILDQKSAIFPLSHLSELPAGEYLVQAVFAQNHDLNLPNAPGNLYSEPRTVSIDPAKGGTIKLELTKAVPDDKPPP